MKITFNHNVLGLDVGRLWRLLCSLCIPKHNACNASLALTLYMADRSFSLRAVFMLIGQRASQMGGAFSHCDVNRGRI